MGNGCCDEYNYNGKSFCDCCIDRVQCCAQDSDDGCLSSEVSQSARLCGFVCGTDQTLLPAAYSPAPLSLPTCSLPWFG